VRRREVEFGSEGYHPRWINGRVAGVVMRLDVLHVHGRGDSRLLVEVSHIGGKIRIVGDSAQVALEVTEIHGIKSNERGASRTTAFAKAL
jgi:hypothetical protein